MKKSYVFTLILVGIILGGLALDAAIARRQKNQLDAPKEVLKSATDMKGERESEEHFYVITKGGDLKLFVSRAYKSQGIYTLMRISAPGSNGWQDEYRRTSRKLGMGWSDNAPTFRYSQDYAEAMFVEALKLPLPDDQVINPAHRGI